MSELNVNDPEVLAFADTIQQGIVKCGIEHVAGLATQSMPNALPNFDAEHCVMPTRDTVATAPTLNNEFTPS